MNNSSLEQMPFAFGVNQFTTMPWSFEQDTDRYSALGVDCIELCEVKLSGSGFTQQLAQLADSPLSISAVQPHVRTLFPSQMTPSPEGVDARFDRLKLSIERLAPFCPGAPFVLNTGAAVNGNVAEVVDVCVNRISELARIAESHGVRLAIEPLNPTLMNTETAIWTVQQALDLLERIDRESVGLCLDLWNVFQEPEVATQISRAGDRIFVLHVSDWRVPRSSGDRLIPGQGTIPIGKLLKAIFYAGYREACTLEIFSNDVEDSIYAGDLEAVLTQSRRNLQHAWIEQRTAPGEDALAAAR